MNKFCAILSLTLLLCSVQAEIEPSAEAGLIIAGILQGALHADMVNLDYCLYDAKLFSFNIYSAVLDFKKETFDGVALGIKEIGLAINQVSNALIDCKNVTADIEYLKTMAKEFESPESFFYHLEKDLVLNGVSIYKDMNRAVDAYDHHEWFIFGSNIGNALALVIMGKETTLNNEDAAAYEILLGYAQSSTKVRINPEEIYEKIQG